MSARQHSIVLPKAGDRLLVSAALLLFGFALHRLITHRPAYEGPGGLVAIGSITVEGAVRRRHAGSLAWSEIEGEGDVYMRDLVYTPPGIAATVRMNDGREVTLPPDSLVQFDEITVSNLEITLREITEPKRQVFRLVPLPKAKRSATLPDIGGLEMLHAELMKRYAGEVKSPATLTRARAVARNPDFALNKLSDYEIKLHFPADGAGLPYTRETWTKMAWSAVPVPGVTYQIEMSLKERFEKKVPYESRTNSLEIQFEKPGKYYWRVMAAGPGGIMTSETRTFTLFPRGRRDVAEDVTAKDFSKFSVEVAHSDDFRIVLTSRGADEAKCTSVGLPPGEYYCRVRNGADRSVVKVYRFEVK